MGVFSLSDAAAEDLVAIFIDGAAEFGLAQADRYHSGIERTFQFLAEYPRAARLRTEISPPVRAYPYKAHLIVYEIVDHDAVLILRVRHGREDWLKKEDSR